MTRTLWSAWKTIIRYLSGFVRLGRKETPMRRRTSNAGIDLICRYEGFSATVYKDVAGYDTIGYGHLLKDGEAFPDPISEQTARDLLKWDVLDAEKAVNDLVVAKINQNQFDALVSWTYNLGRGNLAQSTLIKKVNIGDLFGAAQEFIKWHRAGGKPVRGLIRRRLDEALLYVS